MDRKGIIALVENYEKDIKNSKLEALKIAWHMRGGVSLNEALMLSPEERNIVFDLIKENMETTKKSGLPFF